MEQIKIRFKKFIEHIILYYLIMLSWFSKTHKRIVFYYIDHISVNTLIILSFIRNIRSKDLRLVIMETEEDISEVRFIPLDYDSYRILWKWKYDGFNTEELEKKKISILLYQKENRFYVIYFNFKKKKYIVFDLRSIRYTREKDILFNNITIM